MCYSAEASFGLSAVLLPAGVYCISQAVKRKASLLTLAIIPIAFAVQQFAEGWVWTGHNHHNEEMKRIASFVFLYFALSFWPFWIPLCALVGNTNPRKKAVLSIFTLLGLVGGLMLYLPIFEPDVLHTQEQMHSIDYDIDRSAAFYWVHRDWWRVAYVAVVGVPMLIAPARGFVLLGVALVVAAIISAIVYYYAFTSVWCFMVAFLSLYLCWAFRRLPGSSEADCQLPG